MFGPIAIAASRHNGLGKVRNVLIDGFRKMLVTVSWSIRGNGTRPPTDEYSAVAGGVAVTDRSEGDSVLDPRNHQGKFGADYIRVLASAAGLVWAEDDVDLDGIDLCIKLPGRTPRGFSPRIDVQVKTISTLEVRKGLANFDGLDHAQFNKLAGTDFIVPRYLFIVHVPRSASHYADLSTSGLLLRHIGYYVSLNDRHRLPTSDRTRHIRVKVPVSNVLTAVSLRALVTGSAVRQAETTACS
ncbi:MAG TPA: DUF4365 domain-containing protein [Pseudonocardiaceae bacterium]|jgi:hypothetical protein|nr:DUF4365 domain-containing protein [Pseudonocardiaceae bacterium]